MAPLVYRASERICWSEIDGDWVVYLQLAGTLSTLDHLGATVLTLIEELPGTVAGLSLRIAQATESIATPEMQAQVAAVLAELAQSGIVEADEGHSES